MEFPIELYTYRPNHRKGGYVLYGGNLGELVELGHERRVGAFGYLLPFRDFGFGLRSAAVFESEGKIYVDLGGGPEELVLSGASVSGVLFWKKVTFHTLGGERTVNVLTQPFRYLENDGMFPADVEPIVHVLCRISNPDGAAHYIDLWATRRTERVKHN